MFKRAAKLDELPKGRGLRVRIDDADIALFLREDGSVSAIENVCPHAGIPLDDGEIVDGCVLCPGHGWEFNLTTGEGPFGDRVQLYPVKMEGDEIWVDAESPYEA